MSTMTIMSPAGAHGLADNLQGRMSALTAKQSRRVLAALAVCLAAFVIAGALAYGYQSSRAPPDIVTFAFRV